jgi:RNA polymerase sigma-70 factor (ECF subfamily)
MDEQNWLAQRFEENRGHLRAVAYRMLGSMNEADDAVQETWIRLSRTDTGEVQNLGGWLTTAVARVSLDMLRSRKSRREAPLELTEAEIEAEVAGIDPEHEAMLADSVGPALIVVLETLAPAERLAFVLHDLFAVPFDEIATILGRSPAAARQLASRARRRVQGTEPAGEADVNLQRQIVDAFLAASRNGNFEALLTMLDPDVVFRADAAAVQLGSLGEIRGADAVAGRFNGGAQGAQVALIDGAPGALVLSPSGKPFIVLRFTVTDGRITGIDAVADAKAIKEMDLE